MNPNVTISEAAATYIKKMLDKDKGAGFRLSVKKTGCSGYSYLPAIVEQINVLDAQIKAPNGVTVYIDSSWLHLLNGIHIDYVEEEKSGLKQKRLVFTNPNEATRCGCGESFHIE